MRFLHTGDWHLDKPLRGRDRRDEYEQALLEVLDLAQRAMVDAVLVAGDIFDTATPSAEAERLFYRGFLAPLYRAGISAVLVCGNHDHPQRLEAVRELLALMHVHAVPVPLSSAEGGVVTIPSRDGAETATVACLPWVNPRRVVDQMDWLGTEGQPYQAYSDRVAGLIDHLAEAFRSDTVNVLLSHLMLDGAVVGPGGGERQLHVGQTYAISAQRLPSKAQYIALGHVHRPQEVRAPCPTHYAGSLLQLDFGEKEQQKSVVIVDAHPGTPATIDVLPLRSGRALRDLEVDLADIPSLAQHAGEHAFFRVTVRCTGPVAGLAEQVREVLPDALDIRPDYPHRAPEPLALDGSLGPEALLTAFHREHYGAEPKPELLALFRELHEEASHETA